MFEHKSFFDWKITTLFVVSIKFLVVQHQKILFPGKQPNVFWFKEKFCIIDCPNSNLDCFSNTDFANLLIQTKPNLHKIFSF